MHFLGRWDAYASNFGARGWPIHSNFVAGQQYIVTGTQSAEIGPTCVHCILARQTGGVASYNPSKTTKLCCDG
jgi:hypothetical protein